MDLDSKVENVPHPQEEIIQVTKGERESIPIANPLITNLLGPLLVEHPSSYDTSFHM